MDLLELGLAIFLIGQIARMLAFAGPTRYPDIVELFLLGGLGVAAGLLGGEHLDQYDLVEGVAAAGLALFGLELYVVALKGSSLSIPRGRSNR